MGYGLLRGAIEPLRGDHRGWLSAGVAPTTVGALALAAAGLLLLIRNTRAQRRVTMSAQSSDGG